MHCIRTLSVALNGNSQPLCPHTRPPASSTHAPRWPTVPHCVHPCEREYIGPRPSAQDRVRPLECLVQSAMCNPMHKLPKHVRRIRIDISEGATRPHLHPFPSHHRATTPKCHQVRAEIGPNAYHPLTLCGFAVRVCVKIVAVRQCVLQFDSLPLMQMSRNGRVSRIAGNRRLLPYTSRFLLVVLLDWNHVYDHGTGCDSK